MHGKPPGQTASLRVADAALKKAPVRLCLCRPVSPGKHLSVFSGGVAEVEEAFRAGRAIADETLYDELLLPLCHEQVLAALAGLGEDAPAAGSDDALGIVETFSAAAALRSADAALKAAAVRLAGLRLCDGLGGKGVYFLLGELPDLEAALGAVERVLTPGLLVAIERIARPHPELWQALRDG